MRNLFRSYRTKEDLKAIADAKPKGIHHTVRINSSYNETWEHIWREAKKIGLSDRENRRFVSEERFSYDTIIQTKQHAEKRASISEKIINQYEAIQWEESAPELITSNEKNYESIPQASLMAESGEMNTDKVKVQSIAEQVYKGPAESEKEELVNKSADELIEACTLAKEDKTQESKAYLLAKKDIHSNVLRGLNVKPNDQIRKEKTYLQREENPIHIALSPYESSLHENRNNKNLIEKEEEDILRPLLYETERLQFDEEEDKQHQVQGIEVEYFS